MRIAEIRKKLVEVERKLEEEENRAGLERAVAEMEAWVADRKREFNSPEAVAARQAEYQEMLRQGEEFRKQCNAWEDVGA